MSNEIHKFWNDNKKLIVIAVVIVLIGLSSFAQASISSDRYVAQAPSTDLVPAFQLQITNNDGTVVFLKCASRPNIPDYYVCWFSNDQN